MAAEGKSATTEQYREVPAELLYSRTYETPTLGASLAPYGFGVLVLSALGVTLFLLLSNPVVEGEEVMPAPGEVERLVLNAKSRMSRANAASDFQSGEVLVSIFTDPDGAQIELDFENVGTTPFEYRIRPGVYVLSIRKPDYASVDTILILEAGETTALHFELGQGQSDVSRLVLDDRSSYETGDPPSVASRSLRDLALGTPDLDPPRTVNSPETSPSSAVETASVGAEASSAGAETIGLTAGSAASTGSSATQPLNATPGNPDAATQSTGDIEPDEIPLRADSGETQTVHGTSTRRSGTLDVLVRPWGTIYIDGVLHKKATDIKYVTRLPVGEYTVKAVHPNLGSITKTVRVEADTREEIVLEFP